MVNSNFGKGTGALIESRWHCGSMLHNFTTLVFGLRHATTFAAPDGMQPPAQFCCAATVAPFGVGCKCITTLIFAGGLVKCLALIAAPVTDPSGHLPARWRFFMPGFFSC
jgi:hypothetical protein